MICADAEILICDYVDGTLEAARRGELEQHLRTCPACGELARDAQAAAEFLERVPEVEPPPELLTRMLFEPPWSRGRSAARVSLFGWLHNLVQPVLQPRFAMGMAMTILSLAMLARFIPMRQLKPEDLNPVKVWHTLDDRIYRGWERTVKFYENMKFVYQIRTRLREWQQQQEVEPSGEADPNRRDDSRRLPVQGAPGQTKTSK